MKAKTEGETTTRDEKKLFGDGTETEAKDDAGKKEGKMKETVAKEAVKEAVKGDQKSVRKRNRWTICGI